VSQVQGVTKASLVHGCTETEDSPPPLSGFSHKALIVDPPISRLHGIYEVKVERQFDSPGEDVMVEGNIDNHGISASRDKRARCCSVTTVTCSRPVVTALHFTSAHEERSNPPRSLLNILFPVAPVISLKSKLF
jgi:hypothetical protein